MATDRGSRLTGGFEDFFHTATGRTPDADQARIAAEGLPATLTIPTGADKTATAVLPWLYRRLVRAPELTPRRLVYVLPAHSRPEQVFARVGGWLDRLGYGDEVGVHLLAGAVRDGEWLRHPERTAILVGTHDLLLSRALMRGFADSRRMAPVAYGLLHNDAQWVFDTAYELGPGLPTSVRLQRVRDALGTSTPTATLWMSPASPASPTQDPIYPVGGKVLPAGDIGDLTQAVVAAHVEGTQTAVVLGTVARARALYVALRAAVTDRDVVLIHPYFRSADRRDRLAALGERDRDRIIVGTRALEVGIDLSHCTVLTEVVPGSGSSTVRGSEDDLETADSAWGESDLLALFDTAVDLPDLDVGSWICDSADHTALVAWRSWESWESGELGESGEPSDEEPDPGRDELCP